MAYVFYVESSFKTLKFMQYIATVYGNGWEKQSGYFEACEYYHIKPHILKTNIIIIIIIIIIMLTLLLYPHF